MTQALATLLEHAQRQRDEAQLVLMQAEDLARRMLAQTEQLRTYRGEYAARSPARGGRSAPIALLRCHIDFMQRLEQALAQQQQQAEAAEGRAVMLRQALIERETRVASVRKLIERRSEARQAQDDRRDQRHADEASQQRAWRLSAQALPLAG
ncbi:Flagellar export protein FliJ [Rubrivivax sp. A210]|uniref:flagellar export protein FliJ n=1 Tax=Rubrivivax sp. A210 TaxID=2772301 RepID=UPI001917D1CC|nr:flagellar export protein FliJ [Rubrivivax sp. A210]CAD5373618.1 Flagellar export protein FliJ [Rubrivivax sp. A210]